MSIYITGDIHGEYERFEAFSRENPNLTKDDYLLVAGDFGMLFQNSVYEQSRLDRLAGMPFTVCFIDGNHENFDALSALPTEQWHGGKVHRLRQNILHLMRGQIFEIGGKRIFTMGGAYSIDRPMRKTGKSYWKEELPCDSEYSEAGENLKKAGFQVDIVLTHTAPSEIIRRMGYTPDLYGAELTGFLEWVMYMTSFSDWYFGHWHRDEDIEKFHCLWFGVKKIP